MPGATDRTTALSELVYKRANSALAEQQHVLEGLRNRAGTLLTGAAISTSFLGGQALSTGAPRALSWVAIGCFVVVGMTSLAILWPRLAIELAARPLSATATDGVYDTETPLLLGLAEHLRLSYEQNLTQIARVAGYVRVGAIFLAFEVVWWVADLVTRA